MREPHKGFRPDLIHTRFLEGTVLKNRIDKPTATLLAAATLVGGLGLATPAMAAPATPKPAPTITLPADPATGKDEPQPAPVTWTLLGTTLEAGEDGTLTATLPAFNTKPDGLKATGSDGTKITLTLENPVEIHPKLGLTAGTGTLTAAQSDTHPAVSIPATWNAGEEIKLSDGTPFTQDAQGAWYATYGHELTLRDDNGVPVKNLGLSDGSKTPIDWSEPTLKDGKAIRTGTASGTIEGQEWTATIIASRDTDHTQLTKLIAQAKDILKTDEADHTSESRASLGKLVDEATRLDQTPADDQALADMTQRLQQGIDRLETITWSIGDTQLAHTKTGYEGKADTRLDHEPGRSVDAQSNDPALGKLGSMSINRRQDDPAPTLTDLTLGTATASGTATWAGTTPNGRRPITWSQDYEYTVGTPAEVLAPNGTAAKFTVRNGYLDANATATLDQNNKPTTDTVSVDGKPMQITWSNEVNTTTTDTTTTYTRLGRVEGDLTVQGTQHSQHWVLYLTASRTEGKVASLSVLERKADGTTLEHQVEGFDPAKHEYTLTLPADAVADQYTLGHASAAGDKTPVSEGDPIPPSLGDGATRILKTTLNGATYTVTVRFQKAKPSTANPDARLTGIYVNLDGKSDKGGLIDGWNPDVLDYTLRIKQDAPGAYVLPEAPQGVTLTAGDVKRTAWATTQYWTTRAANGQTRTYSVTVIREHRTPTADEAFKPGAFEDTDGKTPTASRQDTGLASHGYISRDGKYTPVTAVDYTIPEGGRFAYASKQGQTVQVTETKTRGMTWRYTLNVLAPDGVTLTDPAPTFEVTYITEATHRATVTGISVDGKPVPGFDQSKHEYDVQVDNIDHWTATADFDKTSGMGVTIHKEKTRATIAATSADGLTRATYTVNVKERPLLNGNGHDGATVDGLAHTGSDATGLIVAAVGLLGAGIACAIAAALARLRRKPRHDDTAGDRGEEPQA